MPQDKKSATKKTYPHKKIMRKIEEIEKLNYFLYLFIVIVAGLVFFSVSYFTTGKIVEVSNYNEVDRSVELSNITEQGVDISIKSRDEVKIRYYVGTSADTLALFSEVNEYVREDVSQFRWAINGKNHYIQVEFEKMNGNRVKSRVLEVK